MGFTETWSYILSYFGIFFLGLAIFISICAVIPACYWLFSSLASNRGPMIFSRIVAFLVVAYITYSYLGSPFFYGIASWRRTTIISAFVVGLVVPLLRMGNLRLERRSDRGLAVLSSVWWGILVVSEALLVSGYAQQGLLLYLFMAATGLVCGAIFGSTIARLGRQGQAAGQGPAEVEP